MAIFILVAIGLALIAGHHDLAKSLVKPFIGVILVLSFLPPLLSYCRLLALPSLAHLASYVPGSLLAIVVLALVGAIFWRLREHSAHGAAHHAPPPRPRPRALPPPPADDDGEQHP